MRRSTSLPLNSVHMLAYLLGFACSMVVMIFRVFKLLRHEMSMAIPN